MSKFKLKIPKLDWKGKTLKLRTIVLAGAPLIEAPVEVVSMFDKMRKAVRAELSADESIAPATPPGTGPLFMSEPYSDARGEVESIYGWSLQATLYCVDGKPWWLARASNKLDDPPEKSIREIERVVDFLGADVQRDRIMNCSFGNGDGYSMWWTWINQHPLLEVQIRKEPFDMRIVQEGSPCPHGYERMPRATARQG